MRTGDFFISAALAKIYGKTTEFYHIESETILEGSEKDED